MNWVSLHWRKAFLASVCLLLVGSATHFRELKRARPVLIVGTDFAPPYYFQNPDGTMAGVAVDVLTRAASHLDFSLKFVHLSGSPDSFLSSHQVDFWPVLTITEKRKREFHMTEPWLFNTFCLLRRQTGTFPTGKELRIAHWVNAVNAANAKLFFPQARHLPRPTRDGVMAAVCLGLADGGIIETRVLDSLLLDRPRACENIALLKQFIPGATFPMGIAAVKSAGKQADDLHLQITRMANSGELAKIFETWASISSNEANSIAAMNSAEQKTRFAYAALVLILITAVLVLVQFRRVRKAYALARNEYAERKRAEEARRSADRTRNTVLEGAAEGICGLDAQGQTTFINSAAARLLGLGPSPAGPYDFHSLVHGADLSCCQVHRCPFSSNRDGTPEVRVEADRFLRGLQSRFPVEFVFSPLMEDGQFTGAVVTFKDITARQMADLLDTDRNAVLEMLAQNESLERIFDAIARLAETQYPDLFCTIMAANLHCLELRSAPSLPNPLRESLRSLAIRPSSLTCGAAAYWSKPVLATDIASDSLWQAHRQMALESGVACSWSYPILSASNDVLGTVALYGPKAAAPDFGQQNLLQITCRLARLAIEQTRLTQQLHYQAHHDSLTGLPNRLLFEQKLLNALAVSRRDQSTTSLFYIDLDRFKQINDTLSHHVGDLYLCQVATRLHGVLPHTATLARLGGDEFAVVIPSITAIAAEQLALSLLEAMADPFLIDGYTLFGTASVGISLSHLGSTPSELQSCADQAMYRAKGLGRNRHQFYSADMSQGAIAELEMEHLLREALEKNRFELHYQPQCRAGGELIGFEALIRLRHPERGYIPPMEFISIAEQTALIIPIGAWVLRETCRQIACWRSEGAPLVPVSINVSAVQLSKGDFAAQVASALHEFQLVPSSLEIELTESMIMGDFDDSLSQMNSLRNIGVLLSIDDFGTGYSSLSYLHRLPIQTIKIDQSFVRSMDAPVSTRPLVEAIVAAARSLKCNVIAEGVETDTQRRELARMGCDHMQGYFFGRPKPPAEALMPFWLQLAS